MRSHLFYNCAFGKVRNMPKLDKYGNLMNRSERLFQWQELEIRRHLHGLDGTYRHLVDAERLVVTPLLFLFQINYLPIRITLCASRFPHKIPSLYISPFASKSIRDQSKVFSRNTEIEAYETKSGPVFRPSLFRHSVSLFILPVFNRTRDAGAPESTVALGDLFQVLLVTVLSIVEVLPLQDLRGNAAVAFFIQLLVTEEQKMCFCQRHRRQL